LRYRKLRVGLRYRRLRTGWRYRRLRVGLRYRKLRVGLRYRRLRSGSRYRRLRTGWRYRRLRSGLRYRRLRSGWRYRRLRYRRRDGLCRRDLRGGRIDLIWPPSQWLRRRWPICHVEQADADDPGQNDDWGTSLKEGLATPAALLAAVWDGEALKQGA
jgi:hypothetical protein